MKKNIRLLALLICVVILQSCSDNKEKIILNFLNKTEEKFDKKNFEFVDLKFIDTIYNSDIYENPYFLENLSSNSEYYIDTSAVDSVMVSLDGYQDSDPIVPKQIDWSISPYSEQFYNYIKYDGDQSSYTEEENSPNILLNAIVNSNYVDFRSKLLTDITFQNKLKNEISKYDYFKGVFSADSLIKLIEEEKIKRKILYGYLYELTFRSNSVLNKRRIVFDPKKETIISSKKVKN